MSAKGSGHPFGIDFGGSGIKGAPVDLETGEFAQERVRIDTPQPSTPDAVAEVFVELLPQPARANDAATAITATVRDFHIGHSDA